MVFCSQCGHQISDSSAKFCPSCGKEVKFSTTLNSAEIQSKQSLKEKWLDNYFRGSVKSDTGEIWNYDRGILSCQEGNQKGLKFFWTGSNLTTESNNAGTATWDGTKLIFKWPQFKEEFYSYVMDEQSHLFKNERGIIRVNPFKYTSYVNWTYSKDVLKIVEGSDVKEGSSTKYDISGDFPLPLVLFCAMYNRSQKLLDEAIAKSKLSFKRCGKLVLQSGGTPLLCPNCDPTLCIVCQGDLSGSKFQGKICKTCSARKSSCIRCNDPLQGSKVEGFLCTNCGLGKLSDNCCKLSVSSLNPFI